jgi:phosphoadenosine phosphosulfate reductase
VLAIQRGVFKVLPIIDWDNRTVYQYLQKHGLKYHPLWDQGYLSVGDTHTTRKWEPGMAEEETRFWPEKRVGCTKANVALWDFHNIRLKQQNPF